MSSEYYSKNKERIQKVHKDYYLKNKNRTLKKNKEWKENNKERALSATRKWAEEHKERVLFLHKSWREKNKNKFKGYYQKYRKKFPEKIKAGRLARDIVIPDDVVCSICGLHKKIQRHHPDYEKPLEILFVCRGCHLNIHKNLKEKRRYGWFKAQMKKMD